MFASCSKLSYVLIAIMSSRSPVKKNTYKQDYESNVRNAKNSNLVDFMQLFKVSLIPFFSFL